MQLHVRLHLLSLNLGRQRDQQKSLLRHQGNLGPVKVDFHLGWFEVFECGDLAMGELEEGQFLADKVGWEADKVQAQRCQVEVV